MTKRPIFLAGFFLTFSAALSYYVNSSFLADLVGEKRVGLVYGAAAVLTIALISATPRLSRRFGLLPPSRGLALLLAASYLGLFLEAAPLVALIFFTTFIATNITLGLLLDLYLETLSPNSRTGRIRGGYLTVINAAILLAPFASGGIVTRAGAYQPIYFFSLVALLPLLYILFGHLPALRLPPAHFDFIDRARFQNVKRIITLDFLLNLFYFFMVIYLPLHLHTTIGFSWEKIGLIFTVMLLPFVLIQYPLGWLADRKFGEKEILSLGLVIAALATIPIAFLTSRSLAVWAALLFITRVGASAVESMKETYLFKKVNAGDIGIISLSRFTVPLAYLVGSLGSVFFLRFFPIPYLFLLISGLFLLGLYFSLTLEDTR